MKVPLNSKSYPSNGPVLVEKKKLIVYRNPEIPTSRHALDVIHMSENLNGLWMGLKAAYFSGFITSPSRVISLHRKQNITSLFLKNPQNATMSVQMRRFLHTAPN